MREALKLALEALIDLDALHHPDEPESVFAQRAITAIKAALEAPQEPVAIALNTGTKQGVKWLKNVEHGEKLYTTPPTAPVQAPEWWPAVENILNEYGLQAIDFVADFKAAQRPWVGLTVDEMNEMTWGKTVYEILALAEAKLKEKNA